MVSLNDLDAQIAGLDSSDDEDCQVDPVSEDEPAPKKRKLKRKKKKANVTEEKETLRDEGKPLATTRQKKKRDNEKEDAEPLAAIKDARGRSSRSLAKDSGSADDASDTAKKEISTTTGANKKKRRHGASVCFNYLRGACKFEDCMFPHVRPAKLTAEERAQVLAELPRKPFDPVLAEVIKQLNIPRCKNFHNHGTCKLPDGKCHFWHLSDAKIARWAGFEHWCDVCNKPITSEKQLEEHQESKLHKAALAAQGGAYDFGGGSGGHGSWSGNSTRGRGTGRGYPEGQSSEGTVAGRGRARGRGRGY